MYDVFYYMPTLTYCPAKTRTTWRTCDHAHVSNKDVLKVVFTFF